MTLPEMLAEAFRKGDWSLVGEAYKLLTGCDIPPGEADYEQAKPTIYTSESEVKKSPLGKPFKPRFVDDGKIAANDKEFDRKVWAGKQPVERRAGIRAINVVCGKCKHSFDVYPKDLPRSVDHERADYTCNKCLGV